MRMKLKYFLILLLITLSSQQLFSQAMDSTKWKTIISVAESNAYILMNNSQEIKNGNIFMAETGKHTIQVWAPKHDIMEREITVRNDVHLNREFFDLEKTEAFKKRRNNDLLVAIGFGVSLPILAVLDYDYEAFDEQEPLNDIARYEAEVAAGVTNADVNLQIARENYEFVRRQNEDNKKKADTRRAIITGVFAAELVGLTTYVIYRALSPKLKVKNPLLKKVELSSKVGMNYQGVGMRYKF